MKQLTVLLGILLCLSSVSVSARKPQKQMPSQTDSNYPAVNSSSSIEVDSALSNIYKQLMVFPQEKIYVQTDKPYYKAGDTVFYRLFLLDACLHVPFSMSRYVYVEFIDQNNSVEIRQKLRPENGGAYYNSFKLSEHLTQGYYKIRAYTRFMENTGVENFYSKPVFVIAENKEHLKMEINVSAADAKHTSVELRFVNTGSGDVVKAEDVFLQLNGKKQKAIEKWEDGVFEYKLPLTDDDKDRSLYVEVLDKQDSVIFKQFDVVPFTGDSIELTFYPEGGYIVEGRANVIAFKALHKDGSAAEISGTVVDADGETVAKLSTGHDGMGLFRMIPNGKNCFVEYETDAVQTGRETGHAQSVQQMPLPAFNKNPFSLQAIWRNEKLFVSVNKAADAVLPQMYLLVHCRGDMLYFNLWNEEKDVLSLDKDFLRSGVNHLILLSEDYYPLSERLVFCNNNDHLQPVIKADKQNYKSRERVVMNISAEEESPNEFVISSGTLTSDSINTILSVSVTADDDVQIDTTTNILTQILLESELKGRITNPAYYFGNAADADLLMMTHGWTRYDIPKAMRGELILPLIEPEISQSLSGRVVGGLLGRDAANVEVGIMSHQRKEKYFDVLYSDEKGRFRFDNFELPDSSDIVVQVLKAKNRKKGFLEVITDTIEYPLAGDFGFPLHYLKTTNPFLEEIIAETEWRYVYIDGEKVIQMPEVIVKPKRKPKHKGNFINTKPDYFLTEDDIAELGIDDVLTLISKLPYVVVRHRGWNSTIEVHMSGAMGSTVSPKISINGARFYDTPPIAVLELVRVRDIAEIHLINSYTKAMVIENSFGEDLTAGTLTFGSNNLSVDSVPAIIDIITKDGFFYDRRPRFHFKSVMPLGYAVPAEFYSPKYDTDEARKSPTPDLRSTVYWKPDIVINKDGRAAVEFYTADPHTTYSVVTEGISPNGTLIYTHTKAIVKVEK